MNIAFFSDHKNLSGSPAVELQNIANEMTRRGHSVYFFLPDSDDYNALISRISDAASAKRPQNVYILPVLNKVEYKTKDVMKQALKWQIDIVHVFTELSAGKLGQKVAGKLRIPCVFSFDPRHEWQKQVWLNATLEADAVNRTMQKSLKHFDCIVTPAEKWRHYLKNDLRLKLQTPIIPAGLALEPFFEKKVNEIERDEIRHQYDLNSDDFVVLATSGKPDSGNHEITAGALAIARKQNPAFKLLYIGESSMCDRISRTAKEMNIDAAVKTAQLASPEKLAELFRIADVLLITDTGIGTIQLMKEAMASSLPLIVKNSSHFEGIIQHEHNGICCKTLDEYAQALDRLQNDVDLHELLAVNGLETAHHFTLTEQGKRLETCYQKTISNHKSRQNRHKVEKKKYRKKRSRK